jgi:hypothetical protein
MEYNTPNVNVPSIIRDRSISNNLLCTVIEANYCNSSKQKKNIKTFHSLYLLNIVVYRTKLVARLYSFIYNDVVHAG